MEKKSTEFESQMYLSQIPHRPTFQNMKFSNNLEQNPQIATETQTKITKTLSIQLKNGKKK